MDVRIFIKLISTNVSCDKLKNRLLHFYLIASFKKKYLRLTKNVTSIFESRIVVPQKLKCRFFVFDKIIVDLKAGI